MQNFNRPKSVDVPRQTFSQKPISCIPVKGCVPVYGKEISSAKQGSTLVTMTHEATTGHLPGDLTEIREFGFWLNIHIAMVMHA